MHARAPTLFRASEQVSSSAHHLQGRRSSAAVLRSVHTHTRRCCEVRGRPVCHAGFRRYPLGWPFWTGTRVRARTSVCEHSEHAGHVRCASFSLADAGNASTVTQRMPASGGSAGDVKTGSRTRVELVRSCVASMIYALLASALRLMRASVSLLEAEDVSHNAFLRTNLPSP